MSSKDTRAQAEARAKAYAPLLKARTSQETGVEREPAAKGIPEGWPGAVPVTRAVLEETDFLAALEEEDAYRREDARLVESALRRHATRATP